MIRPATLLYGSETKFFQYKKTINAWEQMRIWLLLYIQLDIILQYISD